MRPRHENAQRRVMQRRRNVAPTIAHEHRARGVNDVIRDGTIEQCGARLPAAAIAAKLGMVRAVIVRVDVRASLTELLIEARLDRDVVGFRQHAARDARLIRDNDHRPPREVHLPNGARGVGEKRDVVRIFDVPNILHQRTIAVDEEGRASSL